MNTEIDAENEQLLGAQQETNKIQNVRLNKQLQFLRQLNHSYRVINKHEIIIQDIIYNNQNLHIFIPQKYPFEQPLYSLSQKPEEKHYVSEAIDIWLPKYKILQLVQMLAKRINNLRQVQIKVNESFLLKGFSSPKAIPLIICLAIALRVLVGLGSYSGMGDAPNYGDFQAHRNWMSITMTRPIEYWYDQRDQTPWWRIDYPPVAAYLSYFFGSIFKQIQPNAMQVHQGYESDSLKVYMRFTALLVDIAFLFPPIILLSRQFSRNTSTLLLLVFLIKPDSILIDHGHFQYNSLILGLILFAFYCLLNSKFYLTCFFFTLALHSKQMSSYYALAFFAGLLGSTFQFYHNKTKVLVECIKYALIVFLVSLAIWLPWLGNWQHVKMVVSAIFPIHRGLYQLKVSNFWCISDILMKWQSIFSKPILVTFCALSSIVFSLPSIICLLVKINKKSLTIAFSTISLTFFMFSYHVHQKSILLPLLMAPLLGQIIGGWLAFDLIIAGTLGMFHLLKQDHQQLGYLAILGLYVLYASSYISVSGTLKGNQSQQDKQLTILSFHRSFYDKSLVRVLMFALIVGLHVSQKIISPPSALPYLHNLLFAFFPFCLNCYFLLITNSIQIEWIIKFLKDKDRKSF